MNAYKLWILITITQLHFASEVPYRTITWQEGEASYHLSYLNTDQFRTISRCFVSDSLVPVTNFTDSKEGYSFFIRQYKDAKGKQCFSASVCKHCSLRIDESHENNWSELDSVVKIFNKKIWEFKRDKTWQDWACFWYL